MDKNKHTKITKYTHILILLAHEQETNIFWEYIINPFWLSDTL